MIRALLFLLLASPAWAQCPEGSASAVTHPDSVSVTLSSVLIVHLERDTVGFQRDWSFVLSLDTGPGGTMPPLSLCGLTPIYDGYLSMNPFWGYTGYWCPCPTWFWSSYPISDFAPGDPVVAKVTANPFTVEFAATMPVAIGTPYLLSITTGSGLLAWEFLGTVGVASPPQAVEPFRIPQVLSKVLGKLMN